MTFDQLPEHTKISLIKHQLLKLISDVFNKPSMLKDFVKSKKISEDEAKKILSAVNQLNRYTCACCRAFDASKLSFTPLNPAYDALINVAQSVVKSQKY